MACCLVAQAMIHLTHLPLNAAYMRQWIGSALLQIWLFPYSAPSHYLNQCWVIVNWTPGNKFQWNSNRNSVIFSCNQAVIWMVQSVRPSVCMSVCLSVHLSHLFDYVPIIVSSWNFQELLPVTEVTSMQKVKVRGQRSRSQRSQPNLTVSGL